MGIRVDFLIKHVRPYGMDAWAMVCTPGPGSVSEWLLNNGLSQNTIDTAFNAWAQTANIAIDNQSLPQFVRSAEMISRARWAELYRTSDSTILFLNEPLLKELSFVSYKNAGADFEFSPAEHIPLAVTINRFGNQPVVNRNVAGANLAADASGFCQHFAGLIV